MNKFVNMDIKFLKKGGRKSIPMTKEDLSKKIEEFFIKNKIEYDENHISEFILEEHSKIKKDLSKIIFDKENFTFKEGEFGCTLPNILGFHTLENGFSFLGGMAGGDWEYPLFFIIYWDGKSLRGYIPTYGNSFNVDFKSAFGSEMESDNAEDIYDKKYKEEEDKLIEKLKKQKRKVEFHSYELISDVYVMRYGVEDYTDVEINEEAVIEDITSRIILK